MLKIQGLHAGYGQSRVLHDLSFELGPQEILAVMGRNGMGKSTLLKAIIGMIPLQSGSIAVGDREVSALPSYDRVRAGIAFVPQGRMIFSGLSVTENIQAGARESLERSVWDEIYSLFPVLYQMRSRKGGNLSGGQQQQLAIARALASKPSVLVLDEPTEGIQPSIIKDIASALREIRKLRRLAILVSEQLVSFMMDCCDRALVLDRGRFIHESPRESLNADKVKELLSI
ncbi:MAG: urea ABC transporter ATP-binding subunit UrtE [Limisphaerales bacterium]